MKTVYVLRYGRGALEIKLWEEPDAHMQRMLDAIVEAVKSIGGTATRTVAREETELC